MQVPKIKASIAEYKKYLSSQRLLDEAYWWKIQSNFQQSWDIEVTDFSKMFDSCFQSQVSRRFWKGHDFEPKVMMMKFIELNKDMVYSLFKDLFNEEKSIDGRLPRFKAGCDSLYEYFKETHPHNVLTSHYHHKTETIWRYLAFRFPTEYAMVEFPSFTKTLQFWGAQKPPQEFDYERIQKLCKTIHHFIKQDDELNQLLAEKTGLKENFDPTNMMNTAHFLYFSFQNLKN